MDKQATQAPRVFQKVLSSGDRVVLIRKLVRISKVVDMREANYRSVTANRATVIISQTVYDRRALDNVADLPLINSLNHLAALCSNSELIREAISQDGALERLVSILHECYIPLANLPQNTLNQNLNPLQTVKRDRQLAYLSWKWTLAYQCLVLTGTRGTPYMREQVVKSGIIPIIATVLDNYMIYAKNFDFINNTPIPFTFSELVDMDSDLFHLTEEELQTLNEMVDPSDPYYKEYMAMEKLKLLVGQAGNQFGFDLENVAGLHLKPNVVTELDTDWQSMAQEELCVPLPGSALENVLIMPPRRFFLGKMIPELDDVTWAVQLLAFLTKNTAVKPVLQKTTLVDSLSFRPILENAKRRMSRTMELDMTPLSLHAEESDEGEDGEEEEEEDDDSEEPPEDRMDLSPDVTLIGKYFKEIEHLFVTKQKEHEEEEIYTEKVDDILSVRIKKEEVLRENFKQYCQQQEECSRELTSEDWNRIFNYDTINLFALVERFTVKGSLNGMVNYWSSVIMRNSCRKHEATGVRQCANLNCGKWEDHPKQFPKCRRCKRTKYCSRLCQLESWDYHRFWCQESHSNTTAGTPTSAGNNAPSTSADADNDADADTNTATPTGSHTPLATSAGSEAETDPAQILNDQVNPRPQEATTIPPTSAASDIATNDAVTAPTTATGLAPGARTP